MSNDGIQQKWASLEDWEPQKETISALYWDQNLSLKEVVDIMRTEHGFYATEKMFKSRIKKWGLNKYTSAGKLEKALQDATTGTVTVPVVRGRVVAPKVLRKKIVVVSRERGDQVFGPGGDILLRQARTLGPRMRVIDPSPVVTHLDAPDKYRHIEHCLTAVLEYTRDRTQAAKWNWQTDTFGRPSEDMWQNKILVAYQMVNNGKVKDGFRMIDLCLKNYQSLMQKEHPLLIIETYTTFMYLSLQRLDLAETILRYLAGLSRACLGPSHPFTRVWNSLKDLGMEQLRQAGSRVIKSQLALYYGYFRPDAYFLLNQRVDTARQAHCYGDLSLEEAEADIRYAVELSRKKGSSDHINYSCWAKLMLAFCYKHNRRFVEAQAVLNEVSHHVEAGDPALKAFTINEWYSVYNFILIEIGTYEQRVALYHQRLRWIAKTVGTTHHWATRAIADLDALYRTRNDVEASAKLHEEYEYESSWDVICKKEDGVL